MSKPDPLIQFSTLPEHDRLTITEMMNQAIVLGEEGSTLGEVPVGAVLYDTTSGEIIAQAHNTREQHTTPTGHAEFSAIVQGCQALGTWRLNHCTLVVTLEPCPMCAGLIVNARVGRLVYGASDPKAGAVRSLYRLCDDPRLNHRCQIIAGVEHERCSHQLSSFFRSLRNQSKPGSSDEHPADEDRSE